MSYKCQILGTQSQPGRPLHKVIALTRPKKYTKWIKEEESRPPHWIEVEAGVGYEPVLELSCSADGEQLWLSWSVEERTTWLKQHGYIE